MENRKDWKLSETTGKTSRWAHNPEVGWIMGNWLSFGYREDDSGEEIDIHQEI